MTLCIGLITVKSINNGMNITTTMGRDDTQARDESGRFDEEIPVEVVVEAVEEGFAGTSKMKERIEYKLNETFHRNTIYNRLMSLSEEDGVNISTTKGGRDRLWLTNEKFDEMVSDKEFIRVVEENGMVKLDEVVDALDCSEADARRRLNKLVQEGRLASRNLGGEITWELP